MDSFNSTAFKQSNSLIDKVRKILKKKQKKIIGRKIMKENKKQKIRLTEVKVNQLIIILLNKADKCSCT